MKYKTAVKLYFLIMQFQKEVFGYLKKRTLKRLQLCSYTSHKSSILNLHSDDFGFCAPV